MKLRASPAILFPSFRIARNPPTMKEMMEKVGAVYFIGFFRFRDIGSIVDHYPGGQPFQTGRWHAGV